MSENNQKYEIHLMSNTHWDIDYLWSSKETQLMFEDFINKLIEIFESNPSYKHFHFDSQVYPVVDYLKTRPDMQEKITGLIRDGRLLVGPWFTLPDEFLAGGEFLVRNLLFGHKRANELGGVMKVGYNIFSFGQISQLPQIYSGFGIDLVIIKRGISENKTKKFEFLWESPDGTRVVGHRIGPGGRSNFTHTAYKEALGLKPVLTLDSKLAPPAWEQMVGVVINLSDENSVDMQHRLHMPSKIFDYAKAVEGAKKLKEIVSAGSSTGLLLWFDGFDNAQPYTELTEIIEEANKSIKDATLIHSSLPVFAEKLKRNLSKLEKGNDLETIKGELRYISQDNYIFPGVLSARMPMKQKNNEAETALQMWAEPLSVFSWMLGKRFPEEYLSEAWEDIMINQHHDGVTGTHMDRLYLTMMERYEKSIDISRALARRSIEHICCEIDNSGMDKNDVMLVVFNPLPYTRTEVVKADIDFFWDSQVNSLTIEDFSGNQISCRKIMKREVRTVVERWYYPAMRPMGMNRIQVYFEAKDIPPMGYKAFRVKPGNQATLAEGTMVTGVNTMENKNLKVRIENDGTLTIMHKDSGKVYKGLHYFIDSGDIGHPLFHRAPELDMEITSHGCRCSISKVYESDIICTYMTRVEMQLPEKVENRVIPYGEEGGEEIAPYSRSKSSKPYFIESYISLEKNAERVDIRTIIDNTVEDHWLRVCFPTSIDTDVSFCEGQFDVVERPIIETEDYGKWTRTHFGTPQNREHPQRWFAGASDGKNGLTVINKGLPAYRFRGDSQRIIELSLLRCLRVSGTKKNSTYMEQPLAQCPGRHVFEYSIFPHAGSWKEAQVFKQAYCHNVSLKIAQVRNPINGSLPKETSFIKLMPESLVISCVKRSEAGDSVIVRVWNPLDMPVEGSIQCFKKIKAAQLLNLEEKVMEEIEVGDDGIARFSASAKKIVTLAVVPFDMDGGRF